MPLPLDWTKTLPAATSIDFFIKIFTNLDLHDVYKKQRVTFIEQSSLLVSFLQILKTLYLARHFPMNRFFHAVMNNNGYQQEILFLEIMF
jgi:hypothetical protein